MMQSAVTQEPQLSKASQEPQLSTAAIKILVKHLRLANDSGGRPGISIEKKRDALLGVEVNIEDTAGERELISKGLLSVAACTKVGPRVSLSESGVNKIIDLVNAGKICNNASFEKFV